jgi:hypothetical protein
MRRLLCSGGFAVLTALVLVGSTSAPARLSAAPVPGDKETVKMLATNLAAQYAPLDEKINATAAYKWAAVVYNNPVVPPAGTGKDWTALTPAWPTAPSVEDYTNAANVLKGSLSKISAWPDAPTGEEVLKFATNRCKGPGLGSMLAEKNTRLGVGLAPQDLAKKFDGMRDRLCKAITTAAHIKARYDQYQSAKANGIYLIQRYRTNSHSFDGHERTTQSYFFAKWYPDVANTVVNGPSVETQLVYEARAKYSDQNWMSLADIKEKFSSLPRADACKGLPFKLSADMKVKFSVQEATSSAMTIEACMEFHFIGETYNMELGSLKVPAPFGYMAELESMKDSAKQDLQKKLIDQIFGVFTKEQMGKINQLYDLIEKLS